MWENPPHQSAETSKSESPETRALIAPDSDYIDFYRNIYKYAEELKIESLDPSENGKYLDMVRAGNDLIQAIFDGNPLLIENALQVTNFTSAEATEIDGGRLCTMFAWALNAWIKYGDKYGRPATITESEIDTHVENLREAIGAIG